VKLHQWLLALAVAAGIAGAMAWMWTGDWRWAVTGAGAFGGLLVAGGLAFPDREDPK
jgi:hypothetical protein